MSKIAHIVQDKATFNYDWVVQKRAPAVRVQGKNNCLMMANGEKDSVRFFVCGNFAKESASAMYHK